MEHTMVKSKMILEYIDKNLGVDVSLKTRKRPVVYARSLYFKLMREHTGLSFIDISRSIGHNDHAKVLHSINETFPIAFRYDNGIKEAYLDFNTTNWERLIRLRNKLNDLEDEILKSHGYFPETINIKNSQV